MEKLFFPLRLESEGFDREIHCIDSPTRREGASHKKGYEKSGRDNKKRRGEKGNQASPKARKSKHDKEPESYRHLSRLLTSPTAPATAAWLTLRGARSPSSTRASPPVPSIPTLESSASRRSSALSALRGRVTSARGSHRGEDRSSTAARAWAEEGGRRSVRRQRGQQRELRCCWCSRRLPWEGWRGREGRRLERRRLRG